MSELIERLKAWCKDCADNKREQSLRKLLKEVIAALSVAPAPVAVEPVAQLQTSLTVHDYWLPAKLAELRPAVLVASDFCAQRIGGVPHAEKIREFVGLVPPTPPVQEGPKGVGADAKFEELLESLLEAHEDNVRFLHLPSEIDRDMARNAFDAATEALRAYFKQYSPAQSIPAAPCQCKPDETTGWTDDDIMVPRCNVCGLVVMRVIAERKAERLLSGN